MARPGYHPTINQVNSRLLSKMTLQVFPGPLITDTDLELTGLSSSLSHTHHQHHLGLIIFSLQVLVSCWAQDTTGEAMCCREASHSDCSSLGTNATQQSPMSELLGLHPQGAEVLGSSK